MNQNIIDLLNEINIDTSDLVVDEAFVNDDEPKQLDEEYEYWDWGNHVLHNLNEPGCEHPFALDYDQETTTYHRKIHRYSRKERFRFTVYQLLGVGGNVPREVVDLIKEKLGRFTSKNKIWNSIRKILKDMNLRMYYNRIPTIIQMISSKLQPKNMNKENVFQKIFRDFAKMDDEFDKVFKDKWKRSYFLNLRYVAFKLILKHGIVYPYKITFLRTIRKRKYLENLFDQFLM